MIIQTQEEWNGVLEGCGCCEMPECPIPTRECESIEVPACGHLLPEHEDVTPSCKRYTTKTTTYEEATLITSPNDPPPDDTDEYTLNATATVVIDTIRNGEDEAECRTRYGQDATANSEIHQYSPEYIFSGEWTYSSPLGEFEPYVDGSLATVISCYETYSYTQEFPPDPPESDTEGPTLTFIGFYDLDPDNTWTYTAPATFTKTETIDDTDYSRTVVYSGTPDPFTEFDFPDDVNGESCIASLDCLVVVKSRFKWIVSDTWTGSYFKITWDVVFFPEGYDPEDSESPQPEVVAADQTWTWVGPGDPEDAETWKSDWYVLDPPEDPGQVRVVNVRFECYKSAKFGVKPQVTGEAVELPDP